MYMTCKHYLERVLGWERSKLGFMGKKGLKPEVFFPELMSVRLSERAQLILDTVCLSEL